MKQLSCTCWGDHLNTEGRTDPEHLFGTHEAGLMARSNLRQGPWLNSQVTRL